MAFLLIRLQLRVEGRWLMQGGEKTCRRRSRGVVLAAAERLFLPFQLLVAALNP